MTATAQLYVTSSSQVDRAGGSAWTSIANITASDDTRAVVNLDGGLTSDYLYGTNPGPALAANAYVTGITFKWEGDYYSTFAATLSGVGILIGGARAGTEKTPNQVLTTSDVVYTYGGSTDVWGLTRTDLLPSSVNGTGFGCYSWGTGSASGGSRIGVDSYSMILDYTLFGIRPVGGDSTKFGLVNRGRAF